MLSSKGFWLFTAINDAFIRIGGREANNESVLIALFAAKDEVEYAKLQANALVIYKDIEWAENVGNKFKMTSKKTNKPALHQTNSFMERTLVEMSESIKKTRERLLQEEANIHSHESQMSDLDSSLFELDFRIEALKSERKKLLARKRKCQSQHSKAQQQKQVLERAIKDKSERAKTLQQTILNHAPKESKVSMESLMTGESARLGTRRPRRPRRRPRNRPPQKAEITACERAETLQQTIVNHAQKEK